MKHMLPILLLLAACVSGSGLKSGTDELSAACDPSACRVEVECTDRGTCIVTCYDENDEVVCQEEIACDEPCEKPCDRPCQLPSSCPK